MRERLVRSLSMVAFALLVSAGTARAQQGTLTGRVVDAESGQPINGAQIQFVGAGRAAAGGVLSNAAGQFTVQLRPGAYSVVVIFVGYATQRIDGVRVRAGGAESLTVQLQSAALSLGGITVTASRREEKALDAPASVSVVPVERIEARSALTPVEYIKALPGVDVVQTGLSQSNTVTRGFNNVFSGAMLVLQDNRIARVPSLRLNAYNMIPVTALDIDRIEVLLGPASALYGPNSANGVMHIITTSPIDHPGTSFSLGGGQRSVFQGAFRQAWAFNEKVGLKFSGQYLRGNDWRYTDPEEAKARAEPGANPLIGLRDFNQERFGGEARLDVRPWDDGEVIFSYGLNQMGSSVELTGLGAAQAKDWKYQFGHVRFRKGRFFAQAYMNASNAGGTYLLRTGHSIIDESRVYATQGQYGFNVGGSVDVITGVDYQRTDPRTKGTINGRNENNDRIDEVGGYVYTTTRLSDKVDLVAALRVDHHNWLQKLNYSPRAALVFKPVEGQSFRATFNRAFSTPTPNNLFLDLVAGRIPLTADVGYDIRTLGVPKSGLTFTDRCAGGLNDYCMFSPFAPGTQLPANGAVLWDNVLVPLALSDPTLQGALALMGLTPQVFAQIIGNPGALPGDPTLESWLLRFNQEDLDNPFQPDQGITDVERIRPTITNTFEVGYKGIIKNKLLLSVDGYASSIKDFVGPLRVETPSVFLRGPSVGAFLVKRMMGAGIPAAVAQQLAAGIATTAAKVPLGTVAPDQNRNSDLILTYRNFGDVNLWGLDMGFELLATDMLSLNGSFSYVSDECFDFNNDNSCSSSADVALNAPTTKGSLGARFSDKLSGFTFGARVRYSGAFPMNSGVYIGDVPSYTVVDANVAYSLPWASGAMISLTATNLFDNMHREFIGAPLMGRLVLGKVQYSF